MELVTKGQEEAGGDPETDINLLNKAKMDEYVENRHYLEEAQNTVNTMLERPTLEPINPKEDTIRFMCIDIDTYADKLPVYA